MIKPSIGRVVLFHPNKKSELVFPALVCFVHNDSLINVGGFDNNGNAYGATSVPLLQEGDEAPNVGAYAEWMPYQVGQAKKTEELLKMTKEGLELAKENLGAFQALSEIPAPVLTPGVSGSAGMEDLPNVLNAAVIAPDELDELMPGSTVVKPGDEELPI